MSNNRKIDKAARKFKFVANSKRMKFRFLPDWVLSEATYFEREIQNTSNNHKIYKRGALVFVDFGINVGNELSGNHFGIVLNKKDSQKNGVLTIIPVSSKSNKFSVELDGLISQKSVTFLNHHIRDLEIEKRLLALHEIKDDLTEEEKAERIKTYALNSPSWVEHFKYMTATDFNQKLEKLTQEAKELLTVAEAYGRFNKVSYAKCLDIRTISKSRIIKINQFDPVGKIAVSTETLDKIDQVIAQNFTNISLDNNSER